MRYILSVLAAMVLASLSGQNAFSTANHGSYGAMRYDPTAASGSCLLNQIKTDQQAQALLTYYNIRTPGSTSAERISLANGIFQASALYGGRFEPLTNITVKYSSRSGYSRYLSQSRTIDLNRCNKAGGACGDASNTNVARILHELGHPFGHARLTEDETYYDRFGTQLKGCYPTGYSDDSTIENTAEVFSAFLTHPDKLKNGSPACQRAYNFLSTQVFRSNGRLASCEMQERQQLLAAVQGQRRNVNYTSVQTFQQIFPPRARQPSGVTAAASPAQYLQNASSGVDTSE